MAEVQLEGLWVHDAADPQLDWRRYEIVRQLSRSTVVDGQVYTTASGRHIARRRPGAARPVTVTIRAPRSELRWLSARTGRLLLWRDFAGTVVWGVVWEVPEVEVGEATDLVDVALSVDEVDDPLPYQPDPGAIGAT